MTKKVIASVVLAVSVLCILFFVVFRDPGNDETGSSRLSGKDTTNGSGAAPGGEGTASPPGQDSGKQDETNLQEQQDNRTPSLFGRVINSERAGIGGANIYALEMQKWQERIDALQKKFSGTGTEPSEIITYLSGVLERAKKTIPHTESREDGSYYFYGLKEGEYRILASHPDFLSKTDLWVVINSAEPAELIIPLTEALTISGSVVDEKGRPLDRTRLAVEESSGTGSNPMGRFMTRLMASLDGGFLVKNETTESAADGTFTVTGLAPAYYDMLFRRNGCTQKELWKIPAGSRGLLVVLRKGAAVKGRVVDTDKKPVTGARIVFKPHKKQSGGFNPLARFSSDELKPLGGIVKTSETDQQGRFAATGFQRETYDLAVTTDEYPAYETTVEVIESPVDMGTITLEKGRSISGVVLDPDGNPVKEAEIGLSKPKADGTSPYTMLVQNRSNRYAETKSSAEGTFVFDNLPAGAFDVSISAKDYAKTSVPTVEAGTSDLKITLTFGVDIAGICIDEATRTPVPDVSVRVAGADKTATTNEEGVFEILGISEEIVRRFNNRLFIVSQHTDYEPSSSQYPVPEAGEKSNDPYEIQLKRTRGITGRVVDSSGIPVAGARLRVSIPGIPELLMAFAPGGKMGGNLSDRKGEFTLKIPTRGIPMNAAAVEIKASHPFHGIGSFSSLPVPEQSAPWPDIEIVLKKGAVITGSVTDSEGTAVKRARIQLTRSVPESENAQMKLITSMMPKGSGKTVYSNSEGSFTIEGVYAGTYDIEVHAIGYASETVKSIAIEEEGTHHEDIILDAGGMIEGSVVAADRSPLPDVEIVAFIETDDETDDDKSLNTSLREIRRWALSGTASCRTGAEGEFEMNHLPDCTFLIVARKKGYEPFEIHGVKCGEKLKDIVLLPYGAIHGVVIDAKTRRPVPSFSIQSRAEGKDKNEISFSAGLMSRTFDNDKGRFLFEDVAPGTYTLNVHSTGYAPASHAVDVFPGEIADVKVVLEEGMRMEGIVVEVKTDYPVEGVRIICSHNDPEQRSQGYFPQDPVLSDDQGRFTIDGLVEGSYTCTAQHNLYTVEKQAQFELPRDLGSLVSLKMRPAGTVQGRILNLPSIDRSKAVYQIRLQPAHAKEKHPPSLVEETKPQNVDTSESGAKDALPEHAFPVTTHVSPDGSFSRQGLAPGVYSVELRKVKYTENKQPAFETIGEVEVRAGHTEKVELRIPREEPGL